MNQPRPRASSLVRSLESENDSLRYRVTELESELRALKHVMGLPTDTDRPFGLTRSEVVIYTLLMAREFVSRETIVLALYSDRTGFEPTRKVVDTFVSKVRTKLFPHAMVTNDRDIGWAISREHKSRIRNLLNKGVDDHDRNTRRDSIRAAAPPPNGSPATA